MKHYIIRFGTEETGEAIGIVKLPKRFTSWSIYHGTSGKQWPVCMYEITEVQYESYEVLGLFPVFAYTPNNGGGFVLVYIYDPEFFSALVDGHDVPHIARTKYIDEP